MATETKVLRQASPGPLCNRLNAFTGRVLVRAVGATEDGAKNEAETAARERLNELRDADRNRKSECPPACRTGADSSRTWQDVQTIATHCADADTPVYVSYCWSGWRVTVDCPTDQAQFRDLANEVRHEALEHTVPTVCPGTRIMTGCVIAMGIGTTKAAAERAASNEARARADARIAVHRAIACPDGCVARVTGDTEATPNKVGPTSVIPQARQGNVKKHVAWYAASWKVVIRCAAQGGMRPPRRDEGGIPA